MSHALQALRRVCHYPGYETGAAQRSSRRLGEGLSEDISHPAKSTDNKLPLAHPLALCPSLLQTAPRQERSCREERENIGDWMRNFESL